MVSHSGAHIIVQLQKPSSCHTFICEDTAFSGVVQGNPQGNDLELETFLWGGWRLLVLQAEPNSTIISQFPGKSSPELQASTGCDLSCPAWNQNTDFFFFNLNNTLNPYKTNIFALVKDSPTPIHTEMHTLIFRADL